MSINSIATALLLPPISLALAAVLALLLVRGRWGRGLALVSLAMLLLLSLPVVSMPLLASLRPADAADGAAPIAIVVLGGDVDRIAGPPGATLGRLSLERVRAGAALQRRSGLPVLVSGGTVSDLPVPVGTLMADSLTGEFGVPVRWAETTSLTTWENASNSAPMLAAAQIGRVYLVTHAWHMRRGMLALRRFGIEAVPAPVRTDPWPRFRLGEFLPSAAAWHDSYYALHEWAGLAYYTIRR